MSKVQCPNQKAAFFETDTGHWIGLWTFDVGLTMKTKTATGGVFGCRCGYYSQEKASL